MIVMIISKTMIMIITTKTMKNDYDSDDIAIIIKVVIIIMSLNH